MVWGLVCEGKDGDPAVARVGDEELLGVGVPRDAVGAVQLARAVALAAEEAEGGEVEGGADDDAVVEAVGDIYKVARGVHAEEGGQEVLAQACAHEAFGDGRFQAPIGWVATTRCI